MPQSGDSSSWIISWKAVQASQQDWGYRARKRFCFFCWFFVHALWGFFLFWFVFCFWFFFPVLALKPSLHILGAEGDSTQTRCRYPSRLLVRGRVSFLNPEELGLGVPTRLGISESPLGSLTCVRLLPARHVLVFRACCSQL